MNIAVGQVFTDNDPRMKGRHVRIVSISHDRAFYQDCSSRGYIGVSRTRSALVRRFWFDGKSRKSGFSFALDKPL